MKAATFGAAHRVEIAHPRIERGVVVEAFPAVRYQVVGVELFDVCCHLAGPLHQRIGAAHGRIAQLIAQLPGKDCGLVAVERSGDGVLPLEQHFHVVLEPRFDGVAGVKQAPFALHRRAAQLPRYVTADAAVGIPVVGQFEDEADVARPGQGNGTVEGDEARFGIDSGLQLDGRGIAGLHVVVVGVGAHDIHAEGRHLVERFFDAGLTAVHDVGLIVINVIAVEAERIACQGK